MFSVLCVTSGNECAQLKILDDKNQVDYEVRDRSLFTDTVYEQFEKEPEKALLADLVNLQSNAQVAGVMVDCWWGRVEAAGPGKYNWDGYKNLFSIVKAADLELHVSLPPKAVFQAWGAPMNCLIFGGFEVLHV